MHRKGRLDFTELHWKEWAELTILLDRRALENQSNECDSLLELGHDHQSKLSPGGS